MKTIRIEDKTPIGIAGKDDLITIAIFVEEPIELIMSVATAQAALATFAEAIQFSGEDK